MHRWGYKKMKIKIESIKHKDKMPSPFDNCLNMLKRACPFFPLLKIIQLCAPPHDAVERPEPGHTQVPLQQEVPLYAEADLLAENLGEGTRLQAVVERTCGSFGFVAWLGYNGLPGE